MNRPARQTPELPLHLRRDGVDPLPELTRRSGRCPVVREPGIREWIVTGREEAQSVLSDTSRFSSRPPVQDKALSQAREPGNLLHYDPPEHARLRRMLVPAFTTRRMRDLEPVVGQIVQERLDALAEAGPPADLMRHFGWPVPGLFSCALLGIPRDDRADLGRMLDVRSPSRMDGHSGSRARRRVAAQKAYIAYLGGIVAQQRREPGDNMLGTLVRDHGDELTDAELVGIVNSIMAGALENSTQMLGLGMLALLQHPDQAALLRERPELADRATEELLRYVSVVSTASPRTARTDVTLAGEQIKAGQTVSCSLFAVNRAQAGDRLDITRSDVSHLAFGHGIHHCVGAAMARVQLRMSIVGLLARFPRLRLAVPAEDLRFRPFAAQYGIEELPVAW